MASSHLLSADDLAHSIKVSVSFTDDDGYSETLTSQATDVVVATPNVAATGQPTIAGTTEVGETLTAGDFRHRRRQRARERRIQPPVGPQRQWHR